MKRFAVAVLSVLALGLLAGCGPRAAPSTEQVAIPNPASVYCEQNGGKLDLRTGPDGGVAGICVFPDGSECDEWAYFRGQCKPGDSLPGSTPVQPASLTLAALQNSLYHSPDWGDYQLVDGLYHRPPSAPDGSPDAYLTQMIEPVAFGDRNGDGRDDAVGFL